MSLHLTWPEIAIRLFCSIVAGALIGANRSEHGHTAGLRTSILVTLAACVAMLQVNLLLPLAGRPANSFVMNDLMRLPLGILSGMGFIGAGAIVRRDNLILGVTTAATMWFLTVVGLCFGGGEIALGLIAAVIGILVLSGLKFVEDRMKQDQSATLLIALDASGPDERKLRGMLHNDGYQIASCAFASVAGDATRELTFDLRWRKKPRETGVPEVVHHITKLEGVARIAWTPQVK
jgi:putative Mg2+ transporter-C (MgtC) family protein